MTRLMAGFPREHASNGKKSVAVALVVVARSFEVGGIGCARNQRVPQGIRGRGREKKLATATVVW